MLDFKKTFISRNVIFDEDSLYYAIDDVHKNKTPSDAVKQNVIKVETSGNVIPGDVEDEYSDIDTLQNNNEGLEIDLVNSKSEDLGSNAMIETNMQLFLSLDDY